MNATGRGGPPGSGRSGAARFLEHILGRLGRGRERRRAQRYSIPRLSAHYWDGSVSSPHRVVDISASGAYLVTDKSWYAGTIIELVLQQDTVGDGHPAVPFPVLRAPCKVVRFGSDGIGVEFLRADNEQRRNIAEFLAAAMRNTMPRPNGRNGGRRGQSLIELALVLPLLFLLLVNVVNFGAFLFAWITIANAARSGAQYMVMGGATVRAPRPPSAAEVAAVVTSDVSSLLNRASLQVKVCTNNNGVVECAGVGGPATPTDPEPTHFVLGAVDVTYTYRPPIPLWSFPGLGIHATLPSTTIHQRAAMRMLQ